MISGGTVRLGVTVSCNFDAAACPRNGLRNSIEGNVLDKFCDTRSNCNMFSLDRVRCTLDGVCVR